MNIIKKQDAFIDSLLSEVGVKNISEDNLEIIKDGLKTQLQERVGVEILNALSDEDKEEYLKMVESGSKEDKISEFIETHIDDLENRIKEILQKFREDFLED